MEEREKDLPKKILIVDDNQDSRELVVKVLKNKGYEIVEATDGEEAIEKAVGERPDLILLDISIPKLDGYEVTRRLKSREEFKGTPIVALTAHAMKGDRAKVLEAGCEGYISKPINIRELPDQVKSYIRGKWESIYGGEKE
ncbi:MAG TPA: response regulator [Thermodesulfovibrionales bacterium]|nr:response regulator [Thermodesulfovibrionales bacterium]